jgi:molybdopterin molybdotransferase
MSDVCFTEALLDADTARAQLIAAAKPLGETEPVKLNALLGRTLAQDIFSPLDVPGYDNSAMDGYAVRSLDTQLGDAELPVTQRIPAGHPGSTLAPGEAARIFTGAPLPEGADAVVMQEACQRQDDKIRITRPVQARENVRPRANDLAQGDWVLRQGDKLTAPAIGLLAALGIDQANVYRRLRVALLNTGDEIIEPGAPLQTGQIYNANRYSLTATLQQTGCEIVDLGQIADTFDATRHALDEGARQADLILTSGGVSVGEEDHVRDAVQALGELHLWRVRMKPGKPLAYGVVRQTPLIGLPGNPVSAFVTFCLFAMPFVRAMQGCHALFPMPSRARLAQAPSKPLARREYSRVRLRHQADDLPMAEPFPRQGSDVLSGVVWAEGVLELPENTRLSAGDALNYWSFERLLA